MSQDPLMGGQRLPPPDTREEDDDVAVRSGYRALVIGLGLVLVIVTAAVLLVTMARNDAKKGFVQSPTPSTKSRDAGKPLPPGPPPGRADVAVTDYMLGARYSVDDLMSAKPDGAVCLGDVMTIANNTHAAVTLEALRDGRTARLPLATIRPAAVFHFKPAVLGKFLVVAKGADGFLFRYDVNDCVGMKAKI